MYRGFWFRPEPFFNICRSKSSSAFLLNSNKKLIENEYYIVLFLNELQNIPVFTFVNNKLMATLFILNKMFIIEWLIKLC